MAYPNQQNGRRNNDQPSINTRCYQFFNKDGILSGGTTLKLEMWNEFVSLRIHPALPADQQTASSVYDYNKSVPIVLPLPSALAIGKLLEEKFIPAVKENKPFHHAFFFGKANNDMLAFANLIKNGFSHPVLVIARGLKQGSEKGYEAETEMAHEFTYMLAQPGYSYLEREEGSEVTVLNHEVEFFVEALKSLSISALGGDFHGEKVRDIKARNDFATFCRNLAEKMGFSYNEYGNNNYRGSNYPRQSVIEDPAKRLFSANDANDFKPVGASSPMTEFTELSSLDAL